jgi:hypothetical protein
VKKKEIFIIITSLVIMGGSVFYIMQLLFPSSPNTEITKESEKVPVINTNLDEDTYKIVESLSNYGLPELEGIGKSDIFKSN